MVLFFGLLFWVGGASGGAPPIASPTLTTQASPDTAAGGEITDTATLAGGIAPTGTITFTLYGPDDATCGGAPIHTSNHTVIANDDYVSDPFFPTVPGLYRWVATYSGDTFNNGVTSPCNAANESVTITPGPPNKVVFTQQPSDTVAGSSITPAVTVEIHDEYGNLTSSTADVTVVLENNPSGGTLSGTTTVSAVAGTATFSDLSIDKTGTGYTLTASSPALTSHTSSTFNISPAADDHVVFVQQPSDTQAGSSITPEVTVEIRDQFGNLTSSTASVLVAIGSNPSGGTLSGTTTVTAVNGTATFNDLSIDKAGTGYTLTADSPALTGDNSNSFTITPAADDHLVFVQEPTDATAGSSIAPAITVEIRDQFDNVTTSTASVTMAIDTNPGGGTLSGTTTVSAVNGTATFNDLSIDKAGSGYTLMATSPGLTSDTSSTFNITPAAEDHLVFVQEPTNTEAGSTISPAVTVEVRDQFENLTSSSASVTVAIGSNPGGGTL
ncbi:MAG TPA: hypothetical protein VF788_20650, partial [Pseudonocardiaceae bacterium]